MVCFLIYDYLAITSLGFAFTFYIFFLFLQKLGKEIPIKEFFLLIASFQWIVGAKIAYNLGKVHYKYYMYVSENEYMLYVVPGVLLFYIGMNLVKLNLGFQPINRIFSNHKQRAIFIAVILIFIGLISFFANRYFAISGLGFLLFLSTILLYVGLIYLIKAIPRRKNLIFFSTVLFVFTFSVSDGLFHNLIIISSFLLFFIFNHESRLRSKITLVVFGFLSMYIIQTIKGEFRQIIWEGAQNKNPVEAFAFVLQEEFAPSDPVQYTVNLKGNKELEEQATMNTRLNQGWIISKVMDNVPKNQEFLEGETILEAFEASLLPRFLFPNKKGATDAIDNFRKITGIDITRGTSMGLSIIGEFYANFGVIGGWLAMFIYGFSLTFFIKLFCNIYSPVILLWLILFFFQVVKAETELLKVLNHLFKSIFFFIIFQFVMKVLGVNVLLND